MIAFQERDFGKKFWFFIFLKNRIIGKLLLAPTIILPVTNFPGVHDASSNELPHAALAHWGLS